MSARRGFSLVELTVALVISGIIGVALTRLIISQARFVSVGDAMMRTRSGARAALLAVATELRAVGDSGVIQAAPESITVRVPHAFGIACQQTGGTTVVALLPTDSAEFANASLSGYAWRDSTATWHYLAGATLASASASTAFCTGAAPPVSVLSAPGWPARAIAVSPNDPLTPVGATVFLYHTVRYAFAPSGELAGRRGLWRTEIGTGLREEIAMPFDNSSAFQFIVGPALTLQLTPPADLRQLYGVRLDVVMESERPPQGRSTNVRFNLPLQIVFRNVASP